MSSLTSHIIITAPADAVWEIVAHRFDRIGDWATAIPSSTPSPTWAGGSSAAGAPVGGRVCQTGLRLVPEVTETVVTYDETGRTLTYEATAGVPAFVTAARNQWRVTVLDGDRTEIGFTAQLEVRGLLGRLARWWLLARVGRDGRHVLADLKHYVEHGTPSPRKQRQLTRAGRALPRPPQTPPRNPPLVPPIRSPPWTGGPRPADYARRCGSTRCSH
jgi:hypothetical protein